MEELKGSKPDTCRQTSVGKISRSPLHVHRYVILIFLSLLNFGSNFVYDNPVALQDTIINVMGVDVTQYSLLYSIYSWPNIILPFFGGFLVDRVFGVRLGAIFFSSLVCAGQLIVAVGAVVGRYWLILIGRFVFGLGGESLTVSINKYGVLWFKGKELNMVFGLLFCLPGIGSSLNMDVNNKLYDEVFSFEQSRHFRLGLVLMVGFLICVASLLCAIVLGLLDKRAERLSGRKDRQPGESMSFRDIKSFPFPLWLVFFICLTYYSTFYSFTGLALLFLIDKYGFTTSQANLVNSVVYFVSVVAALPTGIMVDKIGFNLFWVILGTVASLCGHGFLAFLGFHKFLPYVANALRGFTFAAISAALWPMVAYLVQDHQLGTAFGIMQSLQNLGLSVIPVAAGAIIDNCGYLIAEVFYMALLCVTLVCGVMLYILDSVSQNKLNLSARARRNTKKGEEETTVPRNGIIESDQGWQKSSPGSKHTSHTGSALFQN